MSTRTSKTSTVTSSTSRAAYLVTPADARLPVTRMVADDLIDLGEKVAAYFARHRRLLRSVAFEAEIGDTRGVIHQAGLPRPLQFTITKDRGIR